MEFMPEDDEPNLVEMTIEHEISLHALVRSMSPRTFRLNANIKNQVFTIVIDTGSSHNYLQPRILSFLKLPVNTSTCFSVAVGYGEKLHSAGTCNGVEFVMQGTKFVADFHILEFSRADAILGVQWLEGLGKVVADHKKLTMEFEHAGKTITLTGNHTPSILPVTNHQLMRLQRVGAVEEYFLLAFPFESSLPDHTPPAI
nr:reverse transcriptase [Ipomoea batatas]GME10633.1 reverse transcriptase [Ipomoea batatas]